MFQFKIEITKKNGKGDEEGSASSSDSVGTGDEESDTQSGGDDGKILSNSIQTLGQLTLLSGLQ